MIKVIKLTKLRSGKKKYEVTFERNGKTIRRKFGASGMSDFTKHKNKDRRENYIRRHAKDLKTKDPTRPGYLSMYILWNKPSLEESFKDYKRRIGIYNRTGKFPTAITGSKRLSFGNSLIYQNNFGKKEKVPDNVINKTLYLSIKNKIKKSIKGRRWGAYDSGRLVREYKAAGGGYTGKKGKTNLSRWYKEKWVDACAWPKVKSCGRKTKSKIAYCRPSKRVDSKTPKLVQDLTKAQIKSRCARKKKNPMKRITKFGQNYMSLRFYKTLMKPPNDPKKLTIALKQQLLLRCGTRGNNRCDDILKELLLNIYYSVKLKNPVNNSTRKNVDQAMLKIKNSLRKYTFTDFKIEKIDYSKLRNLLVLIQDEVLQYTGNVAIMSSLIFAYMSSN